MGKKAGMLFDKFDADHVMNLRTYCPNKSY